MELKDYLHLYLGCDVKVDEWAYKSKLTEILKDGVIVEDAFKTKIHNGNFKLILRPLSDMTTEEANWVATLCLGDSDFIITTIGMGYCEYGHAIHESVRCYKIETFCEHPGVKNWLPSALLQIDLEENDIIIGRFEDAGKILKDDIIEKPFELTRFLLSKHFDIFRLCDVGLAIDATTLLNKEPEAKECDATDAK